MESELRSLNGHLEQLVAERTREIADTQDVTILALAGLAERRDPETGKHIERTRHFVQILALQLQENPRFREVLNSDNIAAIFKSAPLHDIGKVGVPDQILLKPGRLTEDEFREIQKHPIYGGDALRIAEEHLGYGSFLSLAKDIAYHHHERWDGQGYPFGLAGDDIPWAARLMAVADVYDALTSERPYKKAWSHEDAREEIVQNRGKQFDPEVVDAFLSGESEFIRIANTFQEELMADAGFSMIETTFSELRIADEKKQE